MGLREVAARVRSFPVDLRAQALPALSTELMEIARATASGAMTIRSLELTALPTVSADSVTIRPIPKGVWTFSEAGSYKKPDGWDIKPKGKALRFADGGFAVMARHPNISGRETWTQATDAMAAAMPDVVNGVAVPMWKDTVSG